MSEYPKLMWRPDGREVTVTDPLDEARKRAEEGCVGHGEDPAPVHDEAVYGDEGDNAPTFGPPDDDTYAKRSRKKK